MDIVNDLVSNLFMWGAIAVLFIMFWMGVGEIREYRYDKKRMKETNGRIDAVVADIPRSQP